MEAIQSKVDKETVYKIFDNKITITRGGDSLQIAYSNLDETIKIFKAEIQDEIRALRDSEKGRRCENCDKFFISMRKRKYCSDECGKAANERRKKVNKDKPKKVYKDPVNEFNAEAKANNLSYGKYRAKLYLESMGW